MSKKKLSMFLVLVMIFTMIPANVLALDRTNISVDMDPAITAGVENMFDFIIEPISEDEGKNVATTFSFSNAEDIESFAVWNYENQGWDLLNKNADNEFVFYHKLDIPDGETYIPSAILFKFKEDAVAGQNILKTTLEVVENGTIVGNSTIAESETNYRVIEAPKSVLITNIQGAQINANEWYEFEFTLNAVPGDVGKKVVAVSDFSNADQIESLEYWEVQTNTWENLLLDTDGSFGDADGFEISIANTDLTSKFRVKFKEDASVGTYHFGTQVKLMDGTTITNTVLCEVTASFDVLAPLPEDPSSLTTTINGANIVAGEWYEFDFTLHAKSSDAGKKVVGVSEFDDASQIEALEYWEVADSSWHALPLDGNGVFGDSDGFEMPAVDYDATSKFRVKFKETAMVGAYSFTVQMKLMDGTTITDTTLCSTVANFNVLAPAPKVYQSNITNDLDGDEIVIGEWHEYSYTINMKAADGSPMVTEVATFTNTSDIEALEVWDDVTSTWQPLVLEANGNYYDETPHALPDYDLEVISKYRVKFKETATLGENTFNLSFFLVEENIPTNIIIFGTNATYEVIETSNERVYESTLTNNLDGDEITVGEWHEFSFTLNAKAVDAGVNVVGVSNFANSDDIEAIEYWEVQTNTWENLLMDGDGNFGVSSGFPLPNIDVEVESKFRVKFKETATLGEQSFTAKLMVVGTGDVVTDEEVCSTTATFTVKAASATPPVGESTLTTDINGDAIALDTWHEFTFTLSGSASDAGKKVVGVSQFSDTDIIDALEYWEVADNSWHNLLLDTDGAFGAAEGFDMPAVNFEATSKFRVKFKHPDTIKDSYSFSVQMKVVDGTTVTDEVLCETTATFTLDHEPVIDMTKWVHDETGHWHGATCSCADKVQFAEHIASDWIIDKEAKVGVKGEKHKECTVCGRVLETAEIPAKSSGGGGGGGSSIRTSNIDVRSDDKEIQYRASIIGNSVTISMSNSELKKIVNKNIDVGMVVIDLSSANKLVEKVTVSKGNLEFFLDAVEDTDIEGLTVKFENGLDIVLKMEAIEYLLEETNKDITFFAEEQTNKDLNTKQKDAVKNMTVLGYYEAYISAGNTYIGGFKDGSATLHVDDEILGEYDFHGLGAYSLNDKGETSKVRVYYYENIELSIGENTDYVVVYDKENSIKTCPKNNKCPLHKFMDVNTYDWYHDGIHYALDNGLMVGYSDTKFGPDDAITRGQIVTILWRMENSPVVNYLMTFKDVKSGSYYEEAIRWAQAEGIVGGYNANTFGPDDIITREQMTTIMHRYAEYKEYNVSTDKSDTLRQFEDYAQISDWAVQSVKWAVDNGIIAGYGDGILGPVGTTTRAQAATIMQRFCQEFCK